MSKCKGKDKHGNPCINHPVNYTKFCNFHDYMISYTEEMMNNLTSCSGCHLAKYLGDFKTCNDCKERSRLNREKAKEKIVLCIYDNCIFKKSKENDYCGKHQLAFWKKTVEKNDTKKVCYGYLRGCRQLLDIDDKYSNCKNCRNDVSKIIADTRKSAKKRGLDMELSKLEESVLLAGMCVYCLYFEEHYDYRDIFNSKSNIVLNNKIGKDRIDNTKGYIYDNCCSSCTHCNKLKNDYTLDQIYKYISNIYFNYDGRMEKHKFSDNEMSYMFSESKESAKKRNIGFNIDKKQYYTLIQYKCYYCKNKNHVTTGLDRLDSSKDYDCDNVKASCKICNCMKMEMKLDDFINKMKLLYCIFDKQRFYKKQFIIKSIEVMDLVITKNLATYYKIPLSDIDKYIDTISYHVFSGDLYKMCDKCYKSSELRRFISKDSLLKECFDCRNPIKPILKKHKTNLLKDSKCCGLDKNGKSCSYNPINNTKFCKYHEYMKDYTETMLSNLTLCRGCKKMYYKPNKIACNDCEKKWAHYNEIRKTRY